MSDQQKTYFVAVKRESRSVAPVDWEEELRTQPEVKCDTPAGGRILEIKTTPVKAKQLAADYAFLNIEEKVGFEPRG